MAASVMQSTDFRSVVEPVLMDSFDGLYDQRSDEWRQVFREQTNVPPRAYLEDVVLYGFGVAPQVPEGTNFTYDAGGVLYIYRYVYQVYGSKLYGHRDNGKSMTSGPTLQ